MCVCVCLLSVLSVLLKLGAWGNLFTCPYTFKFQTRPLMGTASGMAIDSVIGRGNCDGANLEI